MFSATYWDNYQDPNPMRLSCEIEVTNHPVYIPSPVDETSVSKPSFSGQPQPSPQEIEQLERIFAAGIYFLLCILLTA